MTDDEVLPDAARLAAFEREHGQTPPPISAFDPALYAQVERDLCVRAAEAGQPRPSRGEVDQVYRSVHSVKYHRGPDLSLRHWKPRQLDQGHAVELSDLRESARAEAEHERESRERWERETKRERGDIEIEW